MLTINNIATELYSMNSIDEGAEYLKLHCNRKQDLVSLADHLGIHSTTRDTISKLMGKIIESTIGYRTRASAIHEGYRHTRPTTFKKRHCNTETDLSIVNCRKRFKILNLLYSLMMNEVIFSEIIDDSNINVKMALENINTYLDLGDIEYVQKAMDNLEGWLISEVIEDKQ